MKKLISLFTILCIVFSLFNTFTVFAVYENPPLQTHTHKVCGDANCADNHEDIEWTAWDSTDTLPTEAGNYYLTKDVTLSEHWKSVNKEINICLNGHIITVGGYTMYAASETTFTDCTDTIHKFSVADNGLWSLDEQNGTETVTGGVITGGKLVGDIIAPHSTLAILSNHILNMYNINIIGNQAKNNGSSDDASKFTYGGGVLNGGTFNMYSGKIIGNMADYGGGVNNVGIFNMTGGEISGNIARYNGGGIDNTITFNMTGGKIINNTAGIEAGGVNQSYIMTIGGTAIIKDNNGSNLYVYEYVEEEKEDYNILFDENTPLTDGAYIGITCGYTTQTKGNPVDITGANDADYSKYFHSDDENYKIVNGENNVIQLTSLVNAYMSRMFFSDNNIQSEKVTSLNQLKELVYEQSDYDGIAEKYDEAFFTDKFLYLYRIDDGSSGNVYNITSAENAGNSINIAVTQEAEGDTDDVVQWFLVVEIDKDLYNKDINVNFTDLQQIDYSIKYENEKAVVTVPQDGTYTVIFASYEGDRLLSVSAQDIQLVKGENSPISPQNFNASGKIKVMLWDSLMGMKPLCATDGN